jgi:CIC family chloride channel protein
MGFFALIPVIGGLVYGPLICRYAQEDHGSGVPEIMIAAAETCGPGPAAGQPGQDGRPRP